MSEKYHVAVTGDDVQEAARFISQAMDKKLAMADDSKAAFFVVLSSFTIAMAIGMRTAGYDAYEVKSIMKQAVQGGISAKVEGEVSN